MKMRVKNLTELKSFARNMLQKVRGRGGGGARVIALYGDLGAGKTAFTKKLAEILGIKDVVTSPTFVIQKIYSIKDRNFDRFIHIDAYRLESEKDLSSIGWEEILLEPRNLIVIEWAERVEKSIPSSALRVKFSFADSTSRDIQFPYGGKKS